MPPKLLVSAFDVIDHGEADAGVVDLLQPYYHPEQMGENPPQLHQVPPLLKGVSLVEFLPQSLEVCPYNLILEGVIHLQLLPDLELPPVFSRPLVEEIAQVISHVIEIGKLIVQDVLSIRCNKQVSNVAVIVTEHLRSLL